MKPAASSFILIALTALACTTSNGEKKAAPPAEKSAPAKAAPSASAWGELLSTYVKDGRVDYEGLAENDRAKLEGVIRGIAEATVPEDRNAKLGFYVDAYNAIVLWAVLENDRPRSVLDVKGFFDAAEHTVAGQKLTLDALEKKVINPFAKDPRTHFVLVCGAVGCPILEGTPFAGSDMDARMDAATRRYLESPTGARISDGKVEVSMIFNWYKDDFGGEKGVVDFVRKHLSTEQATKLGDAPEVAFIDYNWTLNQQ